MHIQGNRRVLATDEWLRVRECDGVYAIGDCATINQRRVMVCGRSLLLVLLFVNVKKVLTKNTRVHYVALLLHDDIASCLLANSLEFHYCLPQKHNFIL